MQHGGIKKLVNFERFAAGPGVRMAPSSFLGWGMMDMLSSLFKILAHVLSWMFVIGMAGTVLLVIPIAAYQLFSVLFQKDHPHELDPSLRR